MNNFRVISLVLALAVSPAALAGVNLKNGNFYISYNDITQEGDGSELNLARTYNSKAAERGWFGFGWGSLFETSLVVMPDGSAAVRENGTGLVRHYYPTSAVDVSGGVDRIVDAATKRDKLTSAAAGQLRQKLLGDADARVRSVAQYGLRYELPANVVLNSNECSGAKLLREQTRYKRVGCDEVYDFFDFQGRLLARDYNGDYRVTLNYEGNRPTLIKDTKGHTLNLKWSSAGLLLDAVGGKQHVTYQYDDNSNLIKSTEIGGNAYTYQYDKNHNLTRIGYIDDKSMQITYVSPESASVSSMTERDGKKTVYEYRTDPKNPQHYWTKIVYPDGISREYEYSEVKEASGATKTETKSGDLIDAKGRVLSKKIGDATVDFAYHPTLDRVIGARINEKYSYTYNYDEAGNIVRVDDSAGSHWSLAYEAKDRIKSVVVTDDDSSVSTEEYLFTYAADGRMSHAALTGEVGLVMDYSGHGIMKFKYDDRIKIKQQQAWLVIDQLIGKVNEMLMLANSKVRLQTLR